MKTLKIIAAALMLILPSVPAWAQGAASSRDSTNLVTNAYASWNSLSGATAAPLVGDPALTGSTATEAGIDWQPMESLRLELEYLYRTSGSDRVGSIADRSDAAFDTRNVMANARVDLKFNEWVTPYVGFGIGWARVEPSLSAATGLRPAGSNDVMAYQGIVGLSVPFTDNFSFFADGRFLRTDDFYVGSTVPTDSHLQSWSALAGFRFTFGR